MAKRKHRKKALTKAEVTAREVAGRRPRDHEVGEDSGSEQARAKMARPLDKVGPSGGPYKVVGAESTGGAECAASESATDYLLRRVSALEQALKGLSHTVLHDYIHWRCEGCGRSNRTLRYLAQLGTYWTCDGCGDQQRDDFRRFHLQRDGGYGLKDRETRDMQAKSADPGYPAHRLRDLNEACDKSEGFLRR